MVRSSKETTSSKRTVTDDKIIWTQYEGSKDSHDEEALQMNVKDRETGDHIFYEPKTGTSGYAGGNRDKK